MYIYIYGHPSSIRLGPPGIGLSLRTHETFPDTHKTQIPWHTISTVSDCGHQTLFTGTSANWSIVYLASYMLKLGMHATCV